MNKLKSILGLETVKAFIIVMLALAIVGVVALIVLGAMTSPQIISQTGMSLTSKFNETLTSVDEKGEYTSCNAQVSGACSGLIVVNATDNAIINAANYTVSNCQFSFPAPNLSINVGNKYNNTNWRVSGTCSYRDSSSSSVTQNVSTGIISFYNSAPTFFALLAVVVIILIISLVVVVVNRFGGTADTSMSGGEAGL